MDSAFQNKHILFLVAPLLLVLALGGFYIDFLKKRYMGQYIREDGPQTHHSKAGTPTMGGVLIIGAYLAGLALLFLTNRAMISMEIWVATLVIFIFAALGMVDDYQKITKKENKGLDGYTKLAIQLSTGMAVGLFLMNSFQITTVDIFGLTELNLGVFFPVFTAFVVTGASNAVNLTDGLDGLAAGTSVIAFMALACLLYQSQQTELAVLTFMLAGACLGFLWFNRNPAQVFMGDTGSLALGGALGAIAVLGGMSFWLILVGGIFVLETLSVIIQVFSFKLTGKRVFRMAPLHHHFELGGMKETDVVWLFYGIELALAFAACLLFYLAHH